MPYFYITYILKDSGRAPGLFKYTSANLEVWQPFRGADGGTAPPP